jgi:hypothetical protein
MSLNTNPTIVAADLAAQLRADPIAASQIIEHIPSGELLDLLNLRVAMSEDVHDQIEDATDQLQDKVKVLIRRVAELEKQLSDERWRNPPTQ